MGRLLALTACGPDRRDYTLFAKYEVIFACGVFEGSSLLMPSGIVLKKELLVYVVAIVGRIRRILARKLGRSPNHVARVLLKRWLWS
jgi:hypothetical protein